MAIDISYLHSLGEMMLPTNSPPDPILMLMLYVTIGVALWIALDPTSYADGLVRAFAQRGSSPTAAMLAVMIVATIAARLSLPWRRR